MCFAMKLTNIFPLSVINCNCGFPGKQVVLFSRISNYPRKSIHFRGEMVTLFGRGNVPHILKYYIYNIDGASILLKLAIIYSRLQKNMTCKI